MITDYIGGEGSAETPKNDYVIYGWPLAVKTHFLTRCTSPWFNWFSWYCSSCCDSFPRSYYYWGCVAHSVCGQEKICTHCVGLSTSYNFSDMLHRRQWHNAKAFLSDSNNSFEGEKRTMSEEAWIWTESPDSGGRPSNISPACPRFHL